MESILAGARDGFFTLDHLFAGLRSAPIGLLDGPIPVLVMAWLIVHSDDIAIYQDGTYQPRLTIEVVERALKAPDRFTLKHVVVVGARRRFLEQLVIGLQPRPLTADARNATVLQVVSPLVSVARGLPEFTRKTTAFLSAASVRCARFTSRRSRTRSTAFLNPSGGVRTARSLAAVADQHRPCRCLLQPAG